MCSKIIATPAEQRSDETSETPQVEDRGGLEASQVLTEACEGNALRRSKRSDAGAQGLESAIILRNID